MVELVKHDPQKGTDTVQKTMKKYSNAKSRAYLSDAQVEYFKTVIGQYKNVRWTFIFRGTMPNVKVINLEQ